MGLLAAENLCLRLWHTADRLRILPTVGRLPISLPGPPQSWSASLRKRIEPEPSPPRSSYRRMVPKGRVQWMTLCSYDRRHLHRSGQPARLVRSSWPSGRVAGCHCGLPSTTPASPWPTAQSDARATRKAPATAAPTRKRHTTPATNGVRSWIGLAPRSQVAAPRCCRHPAGRSD